jgi:hypothetical protein
MKNEGLSITKLVVNVQESHKPRDEPIACPFEYIQKCGQEWSTNNNGKHPTLQHVRDEKPWGSLVEAMLFLEYERLVDRKRKGGNKRSEVGDKGEYK